MDCNRWSGVMGSLEIELYENKGKIFDADDAEIPIPLELVPNCESERYELVVEFEANGYSDPGSYDSPPEFSDEREPINAYIVWHPDEDTKQAIKGLIHGKMIELDEKTKDNLCEIFSDKIYEVELGDFAPDPFDY